MNWISESALTPSQNGKRPHLYALSSFKKIYIHFINIYTCLYPFRREGKQNFAEPLQSLNKLNPSAQLQSIQLAGCTFTDILGRSLHVMHEFVLYLCLYRPLSSPGSLDDHSECLWAYHPLEAETLCRLRIGLSKD